MHGEPGEHAQPEREGQQEGQQRLTEAADRVLAIDRGGDRVRRGCGRGLDLLLRVARHLLGA